MCTSKVKKGNSTLTAKESLNLRKLTRLERTDESLPARYCLSGIKRLCGERNRKRRGKNQRCSGK
jgi:hypothetical protein